MRTAFLFCGMAVLALLTGCAAPPNYIAVAAGSGHNRVAVQAGIPQRRVIVVQQQPGVPVVVPSNQVIRVVPSNQAGNTVIQQGGAQQVIVVRPGAIPTGNATFPYGSRVACPQVPIGNGMARCQ